MFDGSEVMNAGLVEVLQSAQRVAADLDAALYSGPDALQITKLLGRAKRVFAAAEARFAARVVETYAFRVDGQVDEADWFARTTGCGLGEAQSVLKTMERIGSCPATRDALAVGELSLGQAHEITLTEAECPGSEVEMLREAKREALKKLRERGLDKRLRQKASGRPDQGARGAQVPPALGGPPRDGPVLGLRSARGGRADHQPHRHRDRPAVPGRAARQERQDPRAVRGRGLRPRVRHGPECGCGCAKRKGLQNDHVNPVANGGETSLENIDPKCTPSHKAKTKADREAGLLDGRAPPRESAA